MMENQAETVVLCGANSYEEKFYMNPDFLRLPVSVREELQILCVLFTEEAGGILTLEFMRDGTLILKTQADDYDYYYDEIEAQLREMGLKNPIERFNDEYMPSMYTDRFDSEKREITKAN